MTLRVQSSARCLYGSFGSSSRGRTWWKGVCPGTPEWVERPELFPGPSAEGRRPPEDELEAGLLLALRALCPPRRLLASILVDSLDGSGDGEGDVGVG